MDTLATRYRRYRSHGHGPIISGALAPPIEWLLISAVVIGAIWGIVT